MTEIALKIANQVIQLPEPRPRLVAGSVGVYAVTLAYDAQWDDATVRVVVFDGGLCNSRVSVQDTTGTVTIPAECIAHGGRGNWLQIGVLGYDGTGALRITTRAMFDGLRIDPAGASDADVPQDAPAATPGLWEKLVADVGDLSDLQTSDTSSLVAAINELAADATVDATLSVEGAAADAAAVGSAVKELARRDVASVYYFWTSHHTNDVVWAYNQGAPAVIAETFDAGIPDGLKGAAPPCWVVFGNQSYGKVGMNITDARGMVWAGSVDLRDYSIFAVPVTQTLNLTGVKKGQIPRIASVSHGETVVPTAWEAADLPEADNSLGLSSATIGQTIKVKAVDADGKPTAWEAVDMGGVETWEKLIFSIPESDPVSAATINLPSTNIIKACITISLFGTLENTKFAVKVFTGAKIGSTFLSADITNFYTSAQEIRTGNIMLEKKAGSWQSIYNTEALFGNRNTTGALRFISYNSDYLYIATSTANETFYGTIEVNYVIGGSI